MHLVRHMHEQALRHANHVWARRSATGTKATSGRPDRFDPFPCQACLFPRRAGELELDHCSRRPRDRTPAAVLRFPAAVRADHGVETCLPRTKVHGRCCVRVSPS